MTLALGGIHLAEFADASIESRPVAAAVLVEGGEGGHEVFIGPHGQQPRIVQPFHQFVIAAAAEVLALVTITAAHGRKDPFLAAQAVSLAEFTAINSRQHVTGAVKQRQQPAPLRSEAAVVGQHVVLPLGLQPGNQALAPDEGSERLVEGHVAGHPHHAVSEFVQQQLRQVRFRPLNERAEQRVGKPAKSGVGGHGAHEGFQAPGLQRRGPAQCHITVEIAPVRRAAHNGVTPAVRLQ